MLKIIKDRNLLSKPCRLVKKEEMEEANQLGAEMLELLSKSETGIGLAANQVGSDLSVVVMNIKGSVMFINPVIESLHGEIECMESCLSFPGKTISTKRAQHVVISADNHEGKIYFYAPQAGDSIIRQECVLECVCIQHEIDHINGKTMFDRRIDTTLKSVDKYGRNERVIITNGKEKREMKYKKAEPLINTGEWNICLN